MYNGDTREGVATFLLDDAGREIQIGGRRQRDFRGDAARRGWRDGSTVAYFAEQQKPGAAVAEKDKMGTAAADGSSARSFSMMRTNITAEGVTYSFRDAYFRRSPGTRSATSRLLSSGAGDHSSSSSSSTRSGKK